MSHNSVANARRAPRSGCSSALNARRMGSCCAVCRALPRICAAERAFASSASRAAFSAAKCAAFSCMKKKRSESAPARRRWYATAREPRLAEATATRDGDCQSPRRASGAARRAACGIAAGQAAPRQLQRVKRVSGSPHLLKRLDAAPERLRIRATHTRHGAGLRIQPPGLPRGRRIRGERRYLSHVLIVALLGGCCGLGTARVAVEL